MRTSKQLEEYLIRTGYVGRYSDRSHNCFCKKPVIKKETTPVDLKDYPLTPGGGIDINAQLKRVQEFNAANALKVAFDPKKYALQLQRELNLKTPVSFSKSIGRMAPGMRILGSKGGFRFYTIDKRPTTPKVIPEPTPTTNDTGPVIQPTALPVDNLKNAEVKEVKFGGSWLWIILIAGTAYVLSRNSDPKKVEA